MASDENVQLRTLTPRPTEPAGPSPARDALKGNLKAAEAELPLRKKKSWFGSMKDVFHKGALQAKAAVDSMRGEQMIAKHEDETQQMIQTNRSPHFSRFTPEPRASFDSAASTTPLKSHKFSPQLNRRRAFSPREAVSSLRHHLPEHGSRSKRVSVHTIAGRLSTDGQEISGPEQFALSKGRNSDEIEQHWRMSSVASSLVGSIRGLTRRPTKTRATTSLEATRPGNPAEDVPLPSSPITIPSAAPVLGLDLGQPGMDFMLAELASPTDHSCDDEAHKLQDPANFIIDGADGRKSSLTLVPDEMKMQYIHPAVRQRSVTPAEMFLQLPNESVRPSPPPAPTTPLPGTNLSMEMDGASDTASSVKKSQVFERSVTPTTEKDRKELRTMCSLGAIAEACSASRKSPVRETRATARSEESSKRVSPSLSVSPNANPFSPRLSIPSTSTMSSCPSDMQELERQTRKNSKVYDFGASMRTEQPSSTTPQPIDEPFDDSNVASHGPPSPVRSVKLPLRLRIKGPSDESAASVEAQLSPTPVHDQRDFEHDNHCTFEGPTKSAAAIEHKVLDLQNRQHNYAVPQNLTGLDQRLVSPLSPEQTEVLSDDDSMTRAQSLWHSDLVYPSINYSPCLDDASQDDLSPHGGPMVPEPLWHGESSPASSPGKLTWKAGLGGDGFKFSIETWRPGPQPIADPQPQTTPGCQAMDTSIDSVSVDETFETPMGSRASTKSERTPSMGNKLELDARRSERNMRYNALLQEQARQEEQKKSSSPIRMHARFFFGGNSGDLDPNEAQYFPDYSSAYNGSHEDTPETGHQRPNRISSEDSMTMSLRSASDNMDKLRALLGEIESDTENGKRGKDEIVDAFTTASSPRSKRPVNRKARAIRSDSPSPQISSSHPLPATPVLEPIDFSPTAGRDNGSPNRFTVLDVEIDIVSSPTSDATATAADLPVSVPPQQQREDDRKNQVGSCDTLERTLDMLRSSESGYQADDSSMVQAPATAPAVSTKQIPRGYRSQSRRAKGRKALGEISGNSA